MIVKGNVQGVFFRYNVKKIAAKLDLNGFVKNLNDGSIEVVAEGEKINELIEYCRKGPGFAKVEKVDVKIEKPNNEFKDFEIKY